MTLTLDEALAEIRDRARWSEADKGRAFERLARKTLASHPGEYGSHRFERVVPWTEWEGSDGRPDTGIDLVGYLRDGGLAAIQCKLYESGRSVRKADVDGFIAASDRPEFTARILIFTGDRLSPHAERLMSEVVPHVELILLEDMRRWPVDDWAAGLDDDAELVWRHEPHTPMPHQRAAMADVLDGFEAHSRGRMILPCGTGKSVTAMWIAERTAGLGGTVLYLVPSIALLGQTMREWAANRGIEHSYVGVCSDTRAGKTSEDQTLAELTCPVSTDPEAIAVHLAGDEQSMRVVFATYQSLPRISEAQQQTGDRFDLIVCDEAHRTAGADSGDSGFRLVHDDDRIAAARRLYMTATPKIYTPAAKQKAGERGVGVHSMDDETVYGPEFHRLTFGEAIDRELLADYQVVAIAADRSVLGRSPTPGDTLKPDDQVRLAGILDALADPETDGLARSVDRVFGTVAPKTGARRAIAFSTTIRQSKQIEQHLPRVADGLFAKASPDTRRKELIDLEVRHVDGSTDALTRARSLQWLRDGDTGDTGCRMLTNARCLTEGVDVPALNAVVMCSPRKSQIDVVQAVGRVMRRSPNKAAHEDVGYVVVPVVVPDGQDAADALETSAFNEVWTVLRALRSHDERLDVTVNSADISNTGKMPLTVIDDTAKAASRRSDSATADPVEQAAKELQLQLDLHNKVRSVLVTRVGDRQYWKRWGQRVAGITEAISADIRKASRLPATKDHWRSFSADIRGAVGHEHTDQATFDKALVEMLAQHAVTVPVFDELFPASDFASKNPMSLALNDTLAQLAVHGCDPQQHCEPLAGFYKSVAERLADADGTARVKVLLEVYDSFFTAAMPDDVSRLGIVYTPVEIVDFMLRSADAVLRQEFGRGLTDEDVHVLDPFTGTGTYINRLLTEHRSDGTPLVADGDLLRKYAGDGDDTPPELHANEIVLLAYYLAAIQIQAGLATRMPDQARRHFQGLVYGDTFVDTPARAALKGTRRNSRRADRQNDQPIMAIVGNPPWSAGQKSAGDDNPNKDYPEIAQRVRDTYGARHQRVTGKAPGGNAMGNLYIQAIRWASDRLNGKHAGSAGAGLVAFVHPNSLSTGTSLSGMRAALRDEFTGIYVVNLRGDAMKSGDEFRREGDKLFGAGSRNGVQITLLVRNPHRDTTKPAILRYAAVPERSTLKQKFDWLEQLGDATSDQFETVEPNDTHDWVNITDGSFTAMMPVISNDTNGPIDVGVAVGLHARGVGTSCDAYVYSFGRDALCDRMRAFIAAYSDALELVEAGCTVQECTTNDDLAKIKWTDTLKQSLKARTEIVFDESRIREVLYRPFTKLWLYEDDRILSSVKAVSAMFPRGETPPPVDRERMLAPMQNNRGLATVLAADTLSDLNCLGPNQGGARAIPRRRCW